MSKSLDATEAQSAAVAKTPNRVSLADITAAIDTVEYHSPAVAPQMTVAFVKMKNGFIVIGNSAPADPANYDADLGKQFAYDDAIRKVWPLMGFALCNKLAGG